MHFTRGGAPPASHDLAGWWACDPHEVAGRIRDGNLGFRERRECIERAYTGLACAIYPSLREYHVAVEDGLYELDHPEEATRPRRAIPVFEPRANEQWTSAMAASSSSLH